MTTAKAGACKEDKVQTPIDCQIASMTKAEAVCKAGKYLRIREQSKNEMTRGRQAERYKNTLSG